MPHELAILAIIALASLARMIYLLTRRPIDGYDRYIKRQTAFGWPVLFLGFSCLAILSITLG